MRKLVLGAIFIASIITACTKIESTKIGLGLIPPVDGVTTFDTTLEVITNSFINTDTVRVFKDNNHFIGNISNDPLFGKTAASLYLELKPTFYKFFFPGIKDSLIADSAVLVLSYKGAYGDTSINQNWRVFEIHQNSKLKNDSAYPVRSNFNLGPELGSKNFDPRRLGDSVKFGFEVGKNQIRIKLSSSFANKVIKQFDSSNVYSNDSSFRANFAGFAIVPDAGIGNALIGVSLLDTNTKLAMYYSSRTAGATKRDTSVSYFRFSFGGGLPMSGSANRIIRDYSGSQLASHLNNSGNDSLVYIQTAPGTHVRIRIPGLQNLPNSIIHRAELIAEQSPHDMFLDEQLFVPNYLLLSALDTVKNRKLNIRNDFEVLQNGPNVSSFGGFPIKKNIPQVGTVSAYFFNLSRYVQGIVTRKDTSYILHLSAPSNDSIFYRQPFPSDLGGTYFINPNLANNVAVGRVRLGGGSNSRVRMRLRIIYTKI